MEKEVHEQDNGKTYWRGLDELAGTEEYTKWLGDEFPERQSMLEVDRRTMLKFMGAGLALAGVVGCRPLPQDKVIPFVKDPENRPAGTTLYYATAFPFGGYGFPVLVESHEGRPTKLEGNPDHPASGGATDVFTQAAILSMYDPDRLQDVAYQGLPDTFDRFLQEARKVLDNSQGGAGVAILTGTVTSPTLGRLMDAFLAKYPQAKWFQYEAAGNENVRAGSRLACGEFVEPIYDFSGIKTVLSLDGDFMAGTPCTVAYASQFASTRGLEGEMSRLYAVESTPTLTGAFADHRLPVNPQDVYAIASAIAAALGAAPSGASLPAGVSQKWIDVVASDLRNGGLVYVGAHQAPEVHALAMAINTQIGAPVRYVEPAEVRPTLHTESLAALCEAMNRGQVKMLLNFGVNAAYLAPGDLKFVEGLAKVSETAYFALYGDETSKLCKWVVPTAHFLESWGDIRAHDGTAMLMQPLIEPLYGAPSTLEVIARLNRDTRVGEAIVRETWAARLGDRVAWEKALNDGFIANSAHPARSVAISLGAMRPVSPASGTTAVIVPDPTIWDGTYANNGWLQELPKPLTKLTWDNAVHMSPKKAEELGVNFQDLVTVSANGQSVEAAVFIQPGHPDSSVTLHMGYGRTEGGKVLKGCGFDFMKLRTSKQPSIVPVEITKASGTYALATAQLHHSMEGRDIIREGTVASYQADPTLKPEGHHELPEGTLYNLTKEWAKDGKYPQWGMTIDLNLCIGCNACAIACQAENNIPTVGKAEVARGRELHWIRIDRYYKVREGGKSEDVSTGAAAVGIEAAVQAGRLSGKELSGVMDSAKIETVFMPVPCMHCEAAPCEPVCPVAATVHSHEGLNQMVYNRCVGTRYCSNNCPYKVRRFNYYNYQHGQRDIGSARDYGNRNFQGEKDRPLLRLLNNPDVTVRSRGVMEKCTYCVQRINEARIVAKKEDRELREGEIVTACQQVCPAKAITFGNIADPNSAVAKRKAEKRNYGLLTELNTVPRTTYLGKVRNPHPELANA